VRRVIAGRDARMTNAAIVAVERIARDRVVPDRDAEETIQSDDLSASADYRGEYLPICGFAKTSFIVHPPTEFCARKLSQSVAAPPTTVLNASSSS
jgi:hypothetical protein